MPRHMLKQIPHVYLISQFSRNTADGYRNNTFYRDLRAVSAYPDANETDTARKKNSRNSYRT